jgi:hypothetical protein
MGGMSDLQVIAGDRAGTFWYPRRMASAKEHVKPLASPGIARSLRGAFLIVTADMIEGVRCSHVPARFLADLSRNISLSDIENIL